MYVVAAKAADKSENLPMQAPQEMVSAEGLTRLDLSHRALTSCYHVHGDSHTSRPKHLFPAYPAHRLLATGTLPAYI